MNNLTLWFTLISIILTILLTALQLIKTFVSLPKPIKYFLSKPILPWALVILLLIVGVTFLPQIILSLNQKQTTNNEGMPFEVYKSYDFESPKTATDTKPWFSIPIVKNHTSLISTDVTLAHSGSKSYQLIVNTMPYLSDTKTEYAGIGIVDKNLVELNGIKLISAWVLIPYSEPIRDYNFQTHFLAYKYDKNGSPISFTSKDTKVELGKWTRLLLGTFQNSNAIPDFIWNGDVQELYISIWCDKEYHGSIFIDDILFYK